MDGKGKGKVLSSIILPRFFYASKILGEFLRTRDENLGNVAAVARIVQLFEKTVKSRGIGEGGKRFRKRVSTNSQATSTLKVKKRKVRLSRNASNNPLKQSGGGTVRSAKVNGGEK